MFLNIWRKALTEYATGNDGTEFPAKDIDQLIGYIDGTIHEADSFLLSLGVSLEKIIADSNTLDKLDALRRAYDAIISKDDAKEEIQGYTEHLNKSLRSIKTRNLWKKLD